jgi:hypothetical protein
MTKQARPSGLTLLALLNLLWAGTFLLGLAAMYLFPGSWERLEGDMPKPLLVHQMMEAGLATLAVISGVGFLRMRKNIGLAGGLLFGTATAVYALVGAWLQDFAYGLWAPNLAYALLVVVLLSTRYRKTFA